MFSNYSVKVKLNRGRCLILHKKYICTSDHCYVRMYIIIRKSHSSLSIPENIKIHSIYLHNMVRRF